MDHFPTAVRFLNAGKNLNINLLGNPKKKPFLGLKRLFLSEKNPENKRDPVGKLIFQKSQLQK